MKKQTDKRLLASLQSLAIVFWMLFVMAFACGDGDEGENESPAPKPPGNRVNNTTGGRCSTEDEFKALLIDNFSKTFNEYDGKFKETEFDFHTFEIGEPMRFTNAYPIIDAYPAYPVETNYTTRHYIHGSSDPQIFQSETEGKYRFYIDHHGKCVFASVGSKGEPGKRIPYKR